MSPEMYRGSFTEKSDIWSLGVRSIASINENPNGNIVRGRAKEHCRHDKNRFVSSLDIEHHWDY